MNMMLDAVLSPKLLALLGLAAAAFVFVLRKLYPRVYPGIPHNEASAKRIMGDLPELMPLYQQTHQFTLSALTITTRKLGTPVAQMLFPGLRKPLIFVEDPREAEDILLRRNKQFDRSQMFVDLFRIIFDRATIGQFTTPALKAQKRLWADAMSTDFLRRVAAPIIHKSTCELLELWRLKATTLHQDRAFNVRDDFTDAALDIIWPTIIGDEPGMMQYKIQELQNQLAGNKTSSQPLPAGAFIKEEVEYVNETIFRSTNSLFPTFSLKREKLTPRYRRFRRTVNGEMRRAMQKATARFQSLEVGHLDDDTIDRCAMDLVLRRQMLQARKAGVPPSDPTQDPSMLDEMFVLLVGGHDSTANTLSWFVRFMEGYPAVQAELRTALQVAFPGPGLPSATQILEADVPYLDATCEEAFRLASTAASTSRQATVDTQILGYPVPKGAEVFLNLSVNCRPPPVDESSRSSTSRTSAEKLGDGIQGAPGRDLGTFEPRRWLVKDDKTGSETFNAYALPALAFGGGYRGCYGRKLATMEFRIVVVLLVLSFEFLPLPEDLTSMASTERLFREPDFPYARIRAL